MYVGKARAECSSRRLALLADAVCEVPHYIMRNKTIGMQAINKSNSALGVL